MEFSDVRQRLARLELPIGSYELRDELEDYAFALHKAMSDDSLAALVVALLGGSELETVFGAVFLRDFPKAVVERSSKIRGLLADETSETVLREAVAAAIFAADPALCDMLAGFVHHPSSEVRFQLCDALTRCCSHEKAVPLLIGLLSDVDVDVRWSAAYELCAFWSMSPDPEIEMSLLWSRDNDESEEVRTIIRNNIIPIEHMEP
jgi:hypothetical protein